MNNLNGLSTDYSTLDLNLEQKKVILLKNISHSSLLTLHLCPRKFQLDKLRAEGEEEEQEVKIPGNVHFAFGHAVGSGIQTAFLPNSTIEDCYLQAFLSWSINLLEESPKHKKSFWWSLHAIDAAWHLAFNLKKEGWEVAHFGEHQDQPAIEFSFRVEFPDGYKYRGYIDIILHQPSTNKYKIIEVKTTGSSYIHEAQFGNSPQALSYAIVLDWLVKEYASYDVLYLVYKTKSEEWEHLNFTKTRHVKAEWIRNILHDCRTLSLSTKDNYWPKHGESCFSFFQPCVYYGRCGFSDEFLNLSNESRINNELRIQEEKQYQVDIRLEDLLKHQLLSLEELE